MQLGMVGLGRMGSGMTKRLEQHGHEMKTYDPNVGSTAKTLRALAKQLDAPRHVWLMVPSGKITEDTFQKLLDILEPGDTIVDGGNSNFRDSKRRYAEARKREDLVRRRRRLGRDLGPRGRLLPDGRRRQGAGEAAAADLRGAGARERLGARRHLRRRATSRRWSTTGSSTG